MIRDKTGGQILYASVFEMPNVQTAEVCAVSWVVLLALEAALSQLHLECNCLFIYSNVELR